MNCMKCGRELHNKQVFCDGCLLDMEKYPVKPDTPLLLPSRQEVFEVKRKSLYARKVLSPEQRLHRLQTSVRLLMLALAAAIAAFALTALLTLHLLEQRDRSSSIIGQNYRTEQPAE